MLDLLDEETKGAAINCHLLNNVNLLNLFDKVFRKLNGVKFAKTIGS